MQINSYLSFNGNCAEAFRFYEKALGGTILMMQTNGESPMAGQTPPEQRDRVMHVRMAVGDEILMGSDTPPEHYEKPQGFAVALGIADPAEAERVFAALAEGGEVRLPIQKTFWAERFGMLVDRFGTPWFVNCETAGS